MEINNETANKLMKGIKYANVQFIRQKDLWFAIDIGNSV